MFRWMTAIAAPAARPFCSVRARDGARASRLRSRAERFRPSYVSPYSAAFSSYGPARPGPIDRPTWSSQCKASTPSSAPESSTATRRAITPASLAPACRLTSLRDTIRPFTAPTSTTASCGPVAAGAWPVLRKRRGALIRMRAYSPVSPPTEAAFSHFSPVYQLSPGSPGVGGSANLTASGPATIDIHVPSDAECMDSRYEVDPERRTAPLHFTELGFVPDVQLRHHRPLGRQGR